MQFNEKVQYLPPKCSGVEVYSGSSSRKWKCSSISKSYGHVYTICWWAVADLAPKLGQSQRGDTLGPNCQIICLANANATDVQIVKLTLHLSSSLVFCLFQCVAFMQFVLVCGRKASLQ